MQITNTIQLYLFSVTHQYEILSRNKSTNLPINHHLHNSTCIVTKINMLTWYRRASSERIACKSWLTCAYWGMFHYNTSCLNPTWTWTRVPTTCVLTCQIAGAFSIDSTLWATVRGSAHIVWQAWTSRCIANCTALRVWTTRWRHTRIATWRLNRRF